MVLCTSFLTECTSILGISARDIKFQNIQHFPMNKHLIQSCWPSQGDIICRPHKLSDDVNAAHLRSGNVLDLAL